MLSPCLFNLYTDYIRRNARLHELQDGIKIDERNINNVRYVGNITLMEESKEELKGLLVTVKEDSERVSLKLNIKTTTTTTKKNKLGSWIMASGPIQFSSVAQSCPTLCDPMNRSMSDLPVHHQLPESTQIHAHRIGHELMMPSSQLILFVSSCLQYPPALGSFQ